jgi:hypothetical protein
LAVEIKLTSQPSADQVRRLQKTAQMIGAERSILLCRTDKPIVHDSTWITDPVSWTRLLVGQVDALLEFALSKTSFSMPVGRISYHYMQPMRFSEFLAAVDPSALEWLERIGKR